MAKLDTSVVGVTKALPLGGLSVHGPRTLHSSGANEGSEVRKAWILQFRVRRWRRLASSTGGQCLYG